MTAKVDLRDIQGLTPAVDPTTSDKAFALSGKNFVFDSLGPRSIFGDRLLLPQPRSKPQHTQGMRVKFRTGDRCFTIDGHGIWEWSERIGGWVSIYPTQDTSRSPYRWTHGFLTNKFFFCHPTAGILVYDEDSGLCLPHSSVGTATPEEVLAIFVNNGRLCAVGPQFFSWSAASNGLDFEPKLGGGGFQLISDRVPGNPIMLTGYAGGCLTWTTGGVMLSQFTGDRAVYRHRALNTEYRPVNSFCTVRLDDDTSVILDERGLFQAKGESISPFTPLFNEFLLDYLQKNNLKIGQNVRLEWDELQRLLYLSLSLSYSNPIYEIAFVFYPPLDKWGQFNIPHYGIFPLIISGSQREDDYYGFADAQGCVRYWLRTPSRELDSRDSVLSGNNLYYPVVQRPASYVADDMGVTLASVGKANTFSRSGMTQRAGYYAPGIKTPVTAQLMGLDSKLTIGMMRPNGPIAPDQMSELISVQIRSVRSGPENPLTVDYNLGSSTIDRNVVVGAEDFGEIRNFVSYKLRMIGSVDAITEFSSTDPELVSFVEGAAYYSCSSLGIWHMMEITAAEVGDSFHLKTVEFSAIDAGRMF